MTSNIQVALVDYGGVQKSALYGLIDFLEVANIHANQTNNLQKVFEPQVIDFKNDMPTEALFQIVICPPRLESHLPDIKLSGLNWLRKQHQEGAIVCSVCAGAYALAFAGLLDDREVTTHWQLKLPFLKTFPLVRLDIDKVLIDDGDLITTAGVMAWVDLGLHLIERFMGPTIVLSVAHQFLVDSGQREQRYYSHFAPHLGHGNQAILKVQRDLQRTYVEAHTVQSMAIAAGMSLRTFQRHFKKNTGFSPLSYLQHLRVEKARSMLELTDDSFNQIAWDVGYEDSSAFQKVFKRIVGLGPQEYRKRFAINMRE